MKHFETELPENYRKVYEIDAKDKKTALLLNGAGLVLFVLALLPFALTVDLLGAVRGLGSGRLFLFYAVFIVGLLAYFVLHELVHGAVYKLLTHEKLTFGVSWSCAYCGVPNVYVYRLASILAILAPFVVFTAVLLPPAIVLTGLPLVRLVCILLFAIHVSGCVGDLYGAGLMLFRFRDPKLLVRDTGPKQTYYLPEIEESL